MRTDTRTLDEKIADRNAKLDALHEKLTGAVEALVTGNDWRRAIEFAARFRSRSFNNTLLIWAQHAAAHEAGRVPDPWPSYVAGFQQWKTLDRSVGKGQAGYQIFAPVTARVAVSADGSYRRLAKGEQPDPGETTATRMVGSAPPTSGTCPRPQASPSPPRPRPSSCKVKHPQDSGTDSPNRSALTNPVPPSRNRRSGWHERSPHGAQWTPRRQPPEPLRSHR